MIYDAQHPSNLTSRVAITRDEEESANNRDHSMKEKIDRAQAPPVIFQVTKCNTQRQPSADRKQ